MPTNIETVLFDYFNNFKNNMKGMPLYLGGIAGVGGGVGGPPGGFIGQLPQGRITYDLTEAATDYTPPSGYTIVDNLNHIRNRLVVLEGGSGIISSGISSPINVQYSGIPIYDGITTLNFEGNVDVTPLPDGVTVTMEGGYSEPETLQSIGDLIGSADEKSVTNDNDMLGLMDSESSNILKKVSITDLKSILKSYFDTIYTAIETVLGVTISSTPTTGSSNDDGTTITFSHNVLSNDKQILLVGWSGVNNSTVVNSVTFNSVDLTQIGYIGGGDYGRSEFWFLVDPPVGTYDIVVTMSDYAQAECGAVAFKNVNSITPYSGIASNTQSDTVEVSSSSTSIVVGLLTSWGDGGVSPDNSDGQSTLWLSTSDGNWTGHCSYKPGDTTIDLGWTVTTDYAAILAVSID
jgi:hypothetical protein